MENELKKLADVMRDMSDMVGDHHWQAAKAIDELGTLRAELDRMNRVGDANSLELCRALEELKALKSKPINYGQLDPQQQLDVARGEKLSADGLEVVGYCDPRNVQKMKSLDVCGFMVHDEPSMAISAPVILLSGAKRLLSQLREELAQRDAAHDQQVGLLISQREDLAAKLGAASRELVAETEMRIAAENELADAGDWQQKQQVELLAWKARAEALESQQAASVGAHQEALQKIAKYAPPVNCAAKTETQKIGLIAVHALVAFSAPNFSKPQSANATDCGVGTAASVGGEREAFDAWFRRVKGLNDTVGTTFVSEAFFPYKAFKFGIEYGRAALSPAGGGVDMKDVHEALAAAHSAIVCQGQSTSYDYALERVSKALHAVSLTLPAQVHANE